MKFAFAALVFCLVLDPVWGIDKLVSETTALVKSEFVYQDAPFRQCHASTIEEVSQGKLVAAWFGGTREKHPDVGIWLAHNIDGHWSTPIEVANGADPNVTNRYPCWNPVLFKPGKGELWLFYKVGPSPDTWWGMLKVSRDGGKTWSDPERLPDGILGPIKNKPVRVNRREIVCPSSSENDGWRIHFELTRDNGKTWTVSRPPMNEQISAIQPSILKHGKGRLQAIGRTRQGRLFETWSDDNGRSWSAVTLSELPNPNSGTDAVTLRDGRHLLVYNPTRKGRSPLVIAISRDGREWHDELVLESAPGAEFSYPAVIQTSDDLVHVTYTWKRERIKHAVIDPRKLRQDQQAKIIPAK